MTRPRRIVIVGGLPYYVGGEITGGERLLVAAPPAIRSMWRASSPKTSGAGVTGFSARGSSSAADLQRQRGFAEVRTATGGMVA